MFFQYYLSDIIRINKKEIEIIVYEEIERHPPFWREK